MTPKRLGRSVLSGHVALLEAFDFDRPYLTLAELSRSAGMAASTTYRLAAQLCKAGFLERHDDKTYFLGVKLWELAARTPGAAGLREHARDALERVHFTLGQHVQFGILHESQVLILERLSTRDAVPSATVVGGRLPMNASSIGLMLLALSPESVVDEFLQHPLGQYTDATPHDSKEILKLLRRARMQGFVDARGYVHPTVRSVAVPVGGGTGEAEAALAAVLPNDDAPLGRILDVLRTGATEISEALLRADLPPADPRAAPGGRYRPLVHSSDAAMSFLASWSSRPRRPTEGRRPDEPLPEAVVR